MTRGCLSGLAALVGAALLQWTPALAQERDPTAAPITAASGAAGAAATPLQAQASSVVVRNGTPYLVVGTRLVAVGQRVGAARLERITETEIWLRDAERLQKIPRYAGIQRNSAGALPCTHATTALKKGATAPRPAASCGGNQP